MARSFQEIEQQMAEHGIFLPMGEQLCANAENWKRFKPVNSSWKKNKDAYFGIWEHFLTSGKSYYFGIFGIAGEQYKIEHKRAGWTVEEWKEIDSRREEDNRIVNEAIENKRKEASEKAEKMWKAGNPAVSASHPYVIKKKIVPVGAKQLREQILIPVCRDKQLKGLQTIFQQATSEGELEITKLFLKGTDKKGSYAPLGKLTEEPEVIFVCEGWATGCSIYEAVKEPVIVAFDAGNILPVVEGLRKRFPSAKVVICADNDAHYKKNLLAEVKEKFGIELEIGSSKEAHVQYANTTEGQYELKAFWGKEDGVPCIVYTCKRPGQPKANKRTLKNTGVAYAKIAASRFKAVIVIPQFSNKDTDGTDFNDLASEEGIEVVAKQLADWKTLEPEKQSNKKTSSKEESSINSAFIKSLGERFVYIDSTDTCWDVEHNRVVKISNIKSVPTKIISAWLQNEYKNRRLIQPEQLVFEPDPKKVKPGEITTFKGWDIKPDPNADCTLLIEHLKKVCGHNKEVFTWVLRWLAYPLQHPGAKMLTALLIYGEREGTGKSVFFDAIKQIYGDYGCFINQSGMSGDFNGWISRRLFVLADEVISSQDRKHLKGSLKNLVTNAEHIINEKGLPLRYEVNKTNFVFLSNEDKPIELDRYDRRYMCVKFNEESTPEYFHALWKQKNNGGIAGLYHYLLNVDLGDFHESTLPIETEAHKELKLLGGNPIARFLEEWALGETPFPYGPVIANHIFDAFLLWCRSANETYKINKKTFLTKMKESYRSGRCELEFYDNDDGTGVPRQTKKAKLTYYIPTQPAGCTEPYPGNKYEFNSQIKKFQLSVEEARKRMYRRMEAL